MFGFYERKKLSKYLCIQAKLLLFLFLCCCILTMCISNVNAEETSVNDDSKHIISIQPPDKKAASKQLDLQNI